TKWYPSTKTNDTATTKTNKKKIVPRNLADVDLEALKGQMAATIEKKKQDDPKLLRAEIARLKQQKPSAKELPMGYRSGRSMERNTDTGISSKKICPSSKILST